MIHQPYIDKSLTLVESKLVETYMKYIPMICEKNNTRTFELLDEEIQMKNLDIVRSRPLKYRSFLCKILKVSIDNREIEGGWLGRYVKTVFLHS